MTEKQRRSLAARSGFAPLADRMRPRHLDEVVGQIAVSPGSVLRRVLERDQLPSIIFFGPPGTGKTTVARLVAQQSGHAFDSYSAVLSGVKEVREAVDEARTRRRLEGQGTVVFVDEIHRFNKAQQDAFLPHVEDGTIILLGATTENPSFHVNAALLSRAIVVALTPLSSEALISIALRALADQERGLGDSGLTLDDAALKILADTSHGDARSLLNRLEALVSASLAESPDRTAIDELTARRLLTVKAAFHDKDGEEHFNLISAFHKSIRGGDPQATLYWLARMMAGGEDPLYILRRLVRIAIEDVGLADPRAIEVAQAAVGAYRFLGSPEGDLALAQAAVYLATAPKSHAVYAAVGAAEEALRRGEVHPVPAHLRNAPTPLMKQLGYGKGYLYPHDFDDAVAEQDYLPKPLAGRIFYEPSPFGYEKDIKKRMDWWRQVLQERSATQKTEGAP